MKFEPETRSGITQALNGFVYSQSRWFPRFHLPVNQSNGPFLLPSIVCTSVPFPHSRLLFDAYHLHSISSMRYTCRK